VTSDAERGVTVSFDEFAAARTQGLLRFAYLVSRDRHLAEDLVQEALASAHLRWSRIQRADDPDAYVRRIVLNQLHSWRRRHRWTREVSVADTTSSASPGDLAVSHAERDAVWRMLGELSPRQRAVLALRFYEDLDDDAISRVLGCAPATVRVHASKAFAHLRAAGITTLEGIR
jgi:RNA polymerase sigma-70 factor (sigma-E family)